MRNIVRTVPLLCLTASLAAPARADDVSALARRLTDPDFAVYFDAFQALEKLGPEAEPAIPTLLKVLGDFADRRDQAVHVLITIGKPAVPGLKELLKHRQPEVREQAALALVRIDAASEELAEVAAISQQMARAKAGGKHTYANFVKRVKMPEAHAECGLFYECEDHYNTATKYFGHEVPAGWWVYVYPNMYVWRERTVKAKP
jgi:hypothetical protein